MRGSALWVLGICFVTFLCAFVDRSGAQDKTGGVDDKKLQGHGDKPIAVKEEILGGVAFRPEKRKWVRITGRVTVRDAHTLLYDDGTEVDLGGMMAAPELEQKGKIGDSLYPCGREAAEFL